VPQPRLPDLRGYGASSKPSAGAGAVNYSKRAMALDVVEVMEELGFPTFRYAGHDRGARLGYRLALDHPQRVERVALLDVIPTIEQWEQMGWRGGLGGFHWFFLTQPSPLPERMINADPEAFLRHLLESWSRTDSPFTAEAIAHYVAAFSDPDTVRATCDDYRAGAGIDSEFDASDREAGRRIEAPLLVLWGDQRGDRRRAMMETWERWATNVEGLGLPCGHFLPEEAPEQTLNALRTFFLKS